MFRDVFLDNCKQYLLCLTLSKHFLLFRAYSALLQNLTVQDVLIHYNVKLEVGYYDETCLKAI